MARFFFCCLLMLIAWDLARSEEEKPAYRMDEIVVTARRYEARRDRTAENISVLTKEDLESIPAHNVLEMLNFTPCLSVQKNGGIDAVVYPSIQGSEPRHVLVLLDGVPMNTLAEGLGSLEQIGLENVDRIEIIKEAASSAWGASLGGVINIISRPVGHKRTPSGQVSGGYGSWSTHQENFSIQGGVGRPGIS